MRSAFASILVGTGALVLAIKAVLILATGAFRWEDQAIAVGFLLANGGVISFAWVSRASRLRASALVLAALGGVAGFVNLALAAASVDAEPRGPLHAIAALALIAGLLLAGSAGRPAGWARAARVAGSLVVPATIVGGALSLFDERLLEVGILAIAALLGWVAARGTSDTP